MPGQPDGSVPSGRLDVPTLRTIARRAESHALVDGWRFEPSNVSPRNLELSIVASAYPQPVTAARIDLRWFTTDDYSLHYLETRTDRSVPFQCRWDRHPKTAAPRTHFHPPPDAGNARPSPLGSHHLDVLFSVLDWIRDRIDGLTA